MSVESVQPSEELKQRIRDLLGEEGSLAHHEIVSNISHSSSQTQRAINELWREGEIFHTVDRRFELTDNSAD